MMFIRSHLLCLSLTEHHRLGLFPKRYKVQTGVVLVISLIILLLLTLIGLTAMQTTVLEEKMAGNLRDKNIAFQAAESALIVAKDSLKPPKVLPNFTNACTGGFCSENPSISLVDADIKEDGFWINKKAPNLWVATSTVTNLGNNIDPPLYFVQRLGVVCPLPCSTPQYFKITVRAAGGRTNTVVILQAIKSI
jgi:type IV pilus assembly protein PilX